jgi:flagellar biosynthesis protein FlhA
MAAAAKPLNIGGLKPAGGRASLSDLGVPVAVLGIVVALVTPLPSFVLDFLLVLDIAMYISRAVEFNVFPTTLLILTLFRLALNVSSSRLILLDGSKGTAAAGHVIEAFGSFVVGGNYIIGAVIFLVLIAIQYVVINHGAVRISEVTARFTLDALPGKQMAIDADLNAGLIDESEARRRRSALAAEAEFYGAMDGASRFTQRDAVASILITGINIIAGFLIGVFQHDMELKQAFETYTVLTIGDGLVTVIPALMISVAGGIIITRTNSDDRLGREFSVQLFDRPEPLMLSGGVLTAMSLFPGLPTVPFLLLGSSLGFAGWRLYRKSNDATPAAVAAAQENRTAKAAKDNIEALLQVDPISVEVGVGLVEIVEGGQSSPLLQRIASVRRQIAGSLGYVLPTVKVNDNLSIRSREYTISLKGVEVARYELIQGRELAIPSGPVDPSVEGRATRDPAFNLPAVWIAAGSADFARSKGYTVVDATTVLGTHLAEITKRYAHELFGRQDAKTYCDRVAASHPKVIEDLVPKLLNLSTVQKVLQNLLRERVSIRDSVSILESMGEAAQITKNPVLLTEYVRQSIRRTLVKPFLSPNGEIAGYFLNSDLERTLERSVEHTEHNSSLSMDPQKIRDVVNSVSRKFDRPEASGVIVTTAGCRFFLRQVLETNFRNLTVISHSEIPSEVFVRALGSIG